MDFEKILLNAGLRVTPQRLIVLEALFQKDAHPLMDEGIQYVQSRQSHIAVGTIYNIIDLLVEKKIIKGIISYSGIMRFDAETLHHHHLVQKEPNQIMDYFDEELDRLLEDYFARKDIDYFDIESI